MCRLQCYVRSLANTRLLQPSATMAFRQASSIFSPRRKVSVYRVKSEPIDLHVRDNISKEQQFIKCCVKTANNSRCSNHAKMYNEDAKMWVCGIHDNMLKASGICVICLEPMDNPADRIKLGCKHTYHKGCICQLDLASCPCCRAPIVDKYAKKVFTNTKITPLADKVFSLAPEKQKAFFSIANRLVEIMGDISDTDDCIGQIMVLKSYISTYAFGIKSLKQYNGDGLGIMDDWSVAATTAFEHVRQYDTYEGLSFNTEGVNFWVDTQPPQPPQPVPVPIITNEQPFVAVQPLPQPRDPRLAANLQFVPVVQFGQVAPAHSTLQQPMLAVGDVFPPAPLNTDMDWIPPYSPTAPPYSPTSPSLIRL